METHTSPFFRRQVTNLERGPISFVDSTFASNLVNHITTVIKRPLIRNFKNLELGGFLGLSKDCD